jgi:hypothetical protein
VKLDDDHSNHYGTAAAQPRNKTEELLLICNLKVSDYLCITLE